MFYIYIYILHYIHITIYTYIIHIYYIYIIYIYYIYIYPSIRFYRVRPNCSDELDNFWGTCMFHIPNLFEGRNQPKQQANHYTSNPLNGLHAMHAGSSGTQNSLFSRGIGTFWLGWLGSTSTISATPVFGMS